MGPDQVIEVMNLASSFKGLGLGLQEEGCANYLRIAFISPPPNQLVKEHCTTIVTSVVFLPKKLLVSIVLCMP